MDAICPNIKIVLYQSSKIEDVYLLSKLALVTLVLTDPFGIVGRVFANGPRDQGSIPGQVIPKIQKKDNYLTLIIIR